MIETFRALIRCSVGAVLCISGWLHWTNPYQFLDSVFRHDIVGEQLSVAVAMLLPFVQIVAGVALMLSIAEEGAWLASLGLSVVFIAVHATLSYRGTAVDCGCFGAGPFDVDQTASFTIAVLLFAASATTLVGRLRWRSTDGHAPQASDTSQVSAGARRGMTLLELLVAISIIGILVGLTLPAVQSARESARRVSCQSNLRQLGLAVSMYHQYHQCVPISISAWAEGPHPAKQCNGKGWIVGILPHVENENLFNQLKPGFDGDFFSGEGMMSPGIRPVLTTRIPLLHCPSDGTFASPSTTQKTWENIPVSLTNYKGSIGDTRIGGEGSVHGGTEPDCHRIGGCNGLFHRNSYQDPIAFASVTDGLSNTFLIGEDVPSQTQYSVAFFSNGDYASCNGRPNFFPGTPSEWWNVTTFRSLHPGGVQFVFVDGSVRFIEQTVNIDVYRALSTRAGNDRVELP